MDVFKNYQLGCESSLNFVQLLKKIKEKYITINHEIFKVYSQGLFSPLLYYIIQYMNENS